MKNKITFARLRELLSYDPDTGLFRWARDKTNSRGQIVAKKGAVAGGLNSAGYRQMVIDGQHYFAHRLAWLYVHGEWPSDTIDHANGDRSDNRMCNLRSATMRQQQGNRKRNKTSSSGVKGVYLHKSGLWCARVMRGGEAVFNKYFHSKGEAAAAYAEGSKKVFGEFARTK